jgi:hypothetical protein
MKCEKCGNETRFYRKIYAEAAYYPNAPVGDQDGEDYRRDLGDIHCGECNTIVKGE